MLKELIGTLMLTTAIGLKNPSIKSRNIIEEEDVSGVIFSNDYNSPALTEQLTSYNAYYLPYTEEFLVNNDDITGTTALPFEFRLYNADDDTYEWQNFTIGILYSNSYSVNLIYVDYFSIYISSGMYYINAFYGNGQHIEFNYTPRTGEVNRNNYMNGLVFDKSFLDGDNIYLQVCRTYGNYPNISNIEINYTTAGERHYFDNWNKNLIVAYECKDVINPVVYKGGTTGTLWSEYGNVYNDTGEISTLYTVEDYETIINGYFIADGSLWNNWNVNIQHYWEESNYRTLYNYLNSYVFNEFNEYKRIVNEVVSEEEIAWIENGTVYTRTVKTNGNTWTLPNFKSILLLQSQYSTSIDGQTVTQLKRLQDHTGYTITNIVSDSTDGTLATLTNIFSLIAMGFTAWASLFNMQIGGGLTLMTLFMVPITLSILLYILHLIKKG